MIDPIALRKVRAAELQALMAWRAWAVSLVDPTNEVLSQRSQADEYIGLLVDAITKGTDP